MKKRKDAKTCQQMKICVDIHCGTLLYNIKNHVFASIILKGDIATILCQRTCMKPNQEIKA